MRGAPCENDRALQSSATNEGWATFLLGLMRKWAYDIDDEAETDSESVPSSPKFPNITGRASSLRNPTSRQVPVARVAFEAVFGIIQSGMASRRRLPYDIIGKYVRTSRLVHALVDVIQLHRNLESLSDTDIELILD